MFSVDRDTESVSAICESVKNEEDVVRLTVRNCIFTDTSNGIRIKTWLDSQPGIASNFTFKDLVMKNVENPIIIYQQYCPNNSCNIKVPSQVKITNVSFQEHPRNFLQGCSKSCV
ncbi:putative Pectin lyase-like superfamily protein [Melia azedarach]|uniref:Pectin lyase-like superfamily protein n=1 Tax=Melia azedarach TaxID=155640 RepID=A0ACC1WX64_MELAZ|nr:putative Pectin lyase-like superfamily protein [Melia azedarach]